MQEGFEPEHARQQQRLLLGEPGLSGLLLAGWTVAVATGVLAVARGLTGRASCERDRNLWLKVSGRK